MKYVATVRVEVDILDHFIEEGGNPADMVEHEIHGALGGFEIEIEGVKEGELNE